MTADPALKMDITQVGTMTSIFPIAYGFSKFLSGVLGARTSPRNLLAGGLMATAVVNILFGFGSSMVWFCSFWALNGILQVSLSSADAPHSCAVCPGYESPIWSPHTMQWGTATPLLLQVLLKLLVLDHQP